uniref:Uncharacterized protein n=1 Tax=Nothobranchius furzeri TaxID=105023 RepID=A0A8C6NKA2_NOTFU
MCLDTELCEQPASLAITFCVLPSLCKVSMIVFWTAVKCPTEFEGVVGGNVTFCFKVYWPKIEFLYLQRTLHGTETFVNGFHASKSAHPIWHRCCHALQHPMGRLYIHVYGKHHFDYLLSFLLAAPFSKPSVTKTCGKKDVDCNITCASHNGYPRQTITWQTSSNVWNHVDNEKQFCLTTEPVYCLSSSLNLSSHLHLHPSPLNTAAVFRRPRHPELTPAGPDRFNKSLNSLKLSLCWAVIGYD